MDMCRMALEMIVIGWKKGVLRILLMCSSFCLIFSAVILYRGIYFGEKNCDRILKNGAKNFAKFRVDGEYHEIEEFFSDTDGIAEIDSFGGMMDYGSSYWNLEELKEIQKDYATDYQFTLNGQLEIRFINPGLLDLCEFKLDMGTPWEMLDQEEGVKYLYLGSAFRSIPVGTRYEQPVGDDLVVAGILEEGAEWVNTKLLNISEGAAVADLNYIENMDHAVLLVTDDLLNYTFYLSCKPEYEIAQVIEMMKERAEDYGLKAYGETLEYIFQTSRHRAAVLTEGMFSLAWICTVTGLLILVSIQIVDMLEKSKNIGILMTVGYSRAFLQKMFLLRDGILSFLSCLGALLFALCFAKQLFVRDPAEVILRSMFLKCVLPVSFGVIAFVLFVSYLIVYFYFRVNSPAKLIKKQG